MRRMIIEQTTSKQPINTPPLSFTLKHTQTGHIPTLSSLHMHDRALNKHTKELQN